MIAVPPTFNLIQRDRIGAGIVLWLALNLLDFEFTHGILPWVRDWDVFELKTYLGPIFYLSTHTSMYLTVKATTTAVTFRQTFQINPSQISILSINAAKRIYS